MASSEPPTPSAVFPTIREPMPPFQKRSATSRKAAAAIKPDRHTLRDQVLDAIRKAGALGATDEEIQQRTGMNPSTQRPRRIELVTLLRVADSGTTRKTTSGRAATVWVVL